MFYKKVIFLTTITMPIISLFCKSESCKADSDLSSCVRPKSYLQLRSQGANTDRELVGWQLQINKPDNNENYLSVYAAFEYQQTFSPKGLAESMFGVDTLKFAGSLVPDRTKDELIAENFGLPRNYRGSITFCPQVTSVIVDTGLYLSLDHFRKGLYIRLHMPFANCTSSLMGPNNIYCAQGSQANTKEYYSAGFISEEQTETVKTLPIALKGDYILGDIKIEWAGAKFNLESIQISAIADLDLIFGYNFVNNQDYRLGIYFQAVAPTGSMPSSEFLFAPVSGNAKHWEVGGGISFQFNLLNKDKHYFGIFGEGNITHMFANRQCRIFDFDNDYVFGGPFSKYMLLKEFLFDGIYSDNIFSATYATRRTVNVGISVKGDFSLKLFYKYCGAGLDIGWNIYGNSQECISNVSSCFSGCELPGFYGIKGTEDAYLSSYEVTEGNISSNATMIQDNQTQPESSIFNIVPNPILTPAQVAGESTVLLTSESQTPAMGTPVTSLVPPEYFLSSNKSPIYLNGCSKLNIASAESPAILTQKFFAHLSYTLEESENYNPHIGLGTELEYSQNGNCRIKVNTWGIWIKAGVSF